MNDYEKKLEKKRKHYKEKAASTREAARNVFDEAKEMAEVIPFGQPILVGHHSENRDRNYRNKIHNKFGRAFSLHDKAEHYDKKAESVGKGGISSDDPDALKKLKSKLDYLLESHEKMKEANKLIRKGELEKLSDLGFSKDQIKEILNPPFGKPGFARYALTNNLANIKSTQKRIDEITSLRGRETIEVNRDGFIYREDHSINRIMFIFDGKPSKEVIAKLKSNAFKWSPSCKAWIRKITISANKAAQEVLRFLNDR